MIEEVWLPVVGWEKSYEVSDLGRVRSLDRVVRIKNPQGVVAPRFYRGRVLRANVGKHGYLMVSFTGPSRKREYWTVHTVVARAFLGDPPPTEEVRHLNGERTDCRLVNIAYGTRTKNALDRHAHGTMNQPKGEEHCFAKLTKQAVLDLRAGRLSVVAAVVKFGVHKSTAENALKRKTWASVL